MPRKGATGFPLCMCLTAEQAAKKINKLLPLACKRDEAQEFLPLPPPCLLLACLAPTLSPLGRNSKLMQFMKTFVRSIARNEYTRHCHFYALLVPKQFLYLYTEARGLTLCCLLSTAVSFQAVVFRHISIPFFFCSWHLCIVRQIKRIACDFIQPHTYSKDMYIVNKSTYEYEKASNFICHLAITLNLPLEKRKNEKTK